MKEIYFPTANGVDPFNRKLKKSFNPTCKKFASDKKKQ